MSACGCRCSICQAHQAGACCRDFRTSEHPYTFTPKAKEQPLSPSPEIRCDALKDEVIAKARCIRHWHDSDNDGMVVSGSHVRELWASLNRLDAAPATTQAPEIRYQLRNWHHVTCLVAGGACTCLEQREALIAELALKNR